MALYGGQSCEILHGISKRASLKQPVPSPREAALTRWSKKGIAYSMPDLIEETAKKEDL